MEPVNKGTLEAAARTRSSRTSTRVVTIAVVAALYALAKGVTGYIPTPLGVGQLLIGIFVPAFFALVSETVPAAIGAGLGTFVGDSLFLSGSTNPALSLIAGVPANVVAFLFFGWFVKRYTNWRAFLAATVSFVTLGNLIAAVSIVFFGASVYTPLVSLVPKYYFVALILGFTLFWSITMVPIIVVTVPILVRAIRPLKDRVAIITYMPTWSESGAASALLATVLLAFVLGAIIIFYLPGILGLSSYSDLTSDTLMGIVGLVIVVPAFGIAFTTKRTG